VAHKGIFLNGEEAMAIKQIVNKSRLRKELIYSGMVVTADNLENLVCLYIRAKVGDEEKLNKLYPAGLHRYVENALYETREEFRKKMYRR